MTILILLIVGLHAQSQQKILIKILLLFNRMKLDTSLTNFK